MKNYNFAKIRKTNAEFLYDFDLYFFTDNKYVLYKPKGKTIKEIRFKEKRTPDLYIQKKDKLDASVAVQRYFNKKLSSYIDNGNTEKVRESLVNIATETINQPRTGTLKQSAKTVATMMKKFTGKEDLLHQIAGISYKDYTTVLHSVNVMTFMLAFCLFNDFDWKRTQRYALGALLHDVGKTKIPDAILNAPRKLTEDEFKIMKKHPAYGAQILDEANIEDEKIYRAAYEHHEKLDGSGYPQGKKNISVIGQIMGIIDIYEALTNDDRPYRRAMPPPNALRIIKEDAEKGKFIYEFVTRFEESMK